MGWAVQGICSLPYALTTALRVGGVHNLLGPEGLRGRVQIGNRLLAGSASKCQCLQTLNAGRSSLHLRESVCV